MTYSALETDKKIYSEEFMLNWSNLVKLSTRKNVDTLVKFIKSELNSLQNADEKFELLKRFIKSETLSEWIAGGIVAGEIILSENSPLSKKLHEFIQISSQTKDNIHLLRHCFLPLSIAAGKFQEPVYVGKVGKKIIREKPLDLLINTFKFFETFYLIKTFDKLMDETLQGKNSLPINELLSKFKLSSNDVNKFRERLTKEIKSKESLLKKNPENSGLKNEIENIKNKLNVLDTFFKKGNFEDSQSSRHLIKDILKLRLKQTLEVEPKKFLEWLVSSLIISMPFLDKNYNFDLELTIKGIVLYALDIGYPRGIEFIRNIPFVLSYFNNEKVIDWFVDKFKNTLTLFSQMPTELFEYFLDFILVVQMGKKPLNLYNILSQIAPEDYIRIKNKDLRLKSVMNRIFEIFAAEIPVYNKEELGKLIFIAQYDTFSNIHAKNEYYRITKYWERLLELALKKGNRFLWQNVVRILKKIFSFKLSQLEYKKKSREIPSLLSSDIIHQLWVISKITERWRLNTLLMKDVGAILARLLDFEYELIKTNKEPFPVILNFIISNYPESRILSEASFYITGSEGLAQFLMSVNETVMKGEPLELSEYIKIMKNVYDIDLIGLMEFPEKIDETIKDYILITNKWRFIMSQVVESEGEILLSNEAFQITVLNAENHAQKKFEELEKILFDLKSVHTSMRESGLETGVFEYLLESEIGLLNQINTQTFPYYEGVLIQRKLNSMKESRKMLLQSFKESNERRITELYKDLLRDRKSNYYLLPFIENYFFNHYLFDYLARQKIRYASSSLTRVFLKFYRFIVNPFVVFTGIGILYLPLPENWLRFLWLAVVSLTIFSVPSYIVFNILSFLKFLWSKYYRKSFASETASEGISILQLFVPRLFALIVIVSSASLYADETWTILLNGSAVFSILVLIALFLLTVNFVKSSINRKIGIEVEGESVFKRTMNFITLGLLESFLTTTFIVSVISDIMIKKAVPGTPPSSIKILQPFSPFLLHVLESLGLTSSHQGFKLPSFLILAVTIQTLFTAMVLQILLERRELVD